MSLIKILGVQDSALRIFLNTGTLFDVQSGTFVPGTHGGMILNGGLAPSNGFMGRPKMFKSTEMFSYIMRAMGYYPDTVCIIDDTEQALNKSRIVSFSPFDNQADLYDRVVLQSSSDFTLEEFFEQIKRIAKEKLSHKEDYYVETPFLDIRNNKPLMTMRPTFVAYDSWSKAISGAAQNMLDTEVAGSSETNMFSMTDGRVKNMIMTQIPTLATRAGLYFGLSAHVGEKYEMKSIPSPKILPHMRQGDKPKGVGPDFNFLLVNGVDMRSVKPLLDSEKGCQYPIAGGSALELCEVTSVVTRGNNNLGGTQLSLVVSQSKGILSELSNYHYIKENGYFGLVGSKVSHKPAMTDVTVQRTTVREKLKDQKVARSVEIMAQLCYIQNNWVTIGAEVDFSMKPELLAEKLLASDSPSATDILESRGYWTYDKTNPQSYLSLHDILAIAQNIYRPKMIAVTSSTTPKPDAQSTKKKVVPQTI